MPILIDVLQKQYLSEKPKLDSTSYKLFVVNAVICLCRSPKSRITDDLLNIVYVEQQFENKRLEIPDFALDKHTVRGKAMGRGVDYFYTESNKLENEAFANPYTERAKDLSKKHGEPSLTSF